MATKGGAPENQDEYPETEFGGKPLKNMGGIQPTNRSEAVAAQLPEWIPPEFAFPRSNSEQLQALRRTGDVMGDTPTDDAWDGFVPGTIRLRD